MFGAFTIPVFLLALGLGIVSCATGGEQSLGEFESQMERDLDRFAKPKKKDSD